MRGFEPKKKWQRRDLNLRPRAYEAPTLFSMILRSFFEIHLTRIDYLA
jgi:hypothetical protein